MLMSTPAASPYVSLRPRAGTTIACTEAPRGTLWHHFEVDERGFFGSPFGEDRLGWEVVTHMAPIEGVMTICCDRSSLEWLHVAGNTRRVDVIDALDFGGTAGAILQTSWEPDRLPSTALLSQHGLSPLWSLSLAAALGDLNAPVTIIGAQINTHIDPLIDQDPVSIHVLQSVTDALLQEIRLDLNN